MVQTVRQTTTALPLEIVSEIKALSEVEIRSRASGLVVKLMFQPGQRVKEGQPLVTIDARAYDEAVIDAQAKLAESEAQLARARQDVARYQPLLADNAIPRQTYDQAVAQEKANAAVVQARVSGLERARLDRSYMPKCAHPSPARSACKSSKLAPSPRPGRRCWQRSQRSIPWWRISVWRRPNTWPT